ncbi:MAG: acyl-CoA thioesterase/BAAT N-terminal domain-containing protein [Acidobacteriota bacterium]|nr:acyl-CoA thioesterase/BAAT N-terminal domain-containing protein [Acidobacteriota bacterium]
MAPRQKVSFRATTHDDETRQWSSHAVFWSDSQGEIDLAAHEPICGSYRGVSPMGLFWSMRLANGSNAGPAATASFIKKHPLPHWVMLEAELENSAIVSGSIQRKFCLSGTTVRDVVINNSNALETWTETRAGNPTGNVARLFLPPVADGPSRSRLPAVIVVSGSGGGFDVDKAAVLSRHGFATMALAYFGVLPLPNWLHRVPLEYIESALAWLAAQPEVDPERIAILGVSRGAELALLAATRYSRIRAVVAYVPSSVAWDSGGRDKATRRAIPAWTWRGEPIASAPLPLRRFMWRSAFPVVAMKRPVMFRNLFRAGLRNARAVERAAIPVEQISGPILLVSGGDDHVWPAEEMAEAIMGRLGARGFAHRIEHLHYPAAGHLLRYPHLPTTARRSQHEHLRGANFSFGGTPQADAEAQADSWRRAIAFLRRHL